MSMAMARLNTRRTRYNTQTGDVSTRKATDTQTRVKVMRDVFCWRTLTWSVLPAARACLASFIACLTLITRTTLALITRTNGTRELRTMSTTGETWSKKCSYSSETKKQTVWPLERDCSLRPYKMWQLTIMNITTMTSTVILAFLAVHSLLILWGHTMETARCTVIATRIHEDVEAKMYINQ